MKPATILLVLFLPLLANAAPIEVSNTAGQKMTVEVLAYTASSGNVRVKRTDGQIFNTKIDVFNPASQKLIAENAPLALPEFTMDVSIGKKRKDQAGSSYMENMTISSSAKISNPSRDLDLPQTHFTILLIGRNSRRYANRAEDWLKILSVQKFQTELVAGKFSEHELEKIETSYDSDKDSSNVGGWEFEGYLLVAMDPEGKILATKSTIGSVATTTLKDEKQIRKALELGVGLEVNPDLSPRGSSR